MKTYQLLSFGVLLAFLDISARLFSIWPFLKLRVSCNFTVFHFHELFLLLFSCFINILGYNISSWQKCLYEHYTVQHQQYDKQNHQYKSKYPYLFFFITCSIYSVDLKIDKYCKKAQTFKSIHVFPYKWLFYKIKEKWEGYQNDYSSYLWWSPKRSKDNN